MNVLLRCARSLVAFRASLLVLFLLALGTTGVAVPHALAEPGTVVLNDGSRAEGDLAVTPRERVVVRFADGTVRIVAWADVRLVFVAGTVIDPSGVATTVPRGPARVRANERVDRGDHAGSAYARSLPQPVVIRTELGLGGVVLAGGLTLVGLGGAASGGSLDSDRPRALLLAGTFVSIGGAVLLGLGIHDKRLRRRGLDELGRRDVGLRMGFDLQLAPGHLVPSLTLRF